MNGDQSQRDDPIVQLAAFRVGAEEYVIDIMRVRTLLRPMQVTPVRKGPRYVEGVINLRGTVIPLVDMRRRFDLPPADHTLGKIIVMSVASRIVGLKVDSVTDVVRIPRSSIRPAPEFFAGGQAPFFMGICHYKSRTLVLLNVKNILGRDDPIELPNPSLLEEAAK